MPFIWWLSEREHAAIGEAPADLPDYIRSEYMSMAGRPRRGRLWIAPGVDAVDVSHLPDEAFLAIDEHWENFGGIVIRDADLRAVQCFPGAVTDVTLRRLSDPVYALPTGPHMHDGNVTSGDAIKAALLIHPWSTLAELQRLIPWAHPENVRAAVDSYLSRRVIISECREPTPPQPR